MRYHSPSLGTGVRVLNYFFGKDEK